LYSDADITALMEAATTLRSPLRVATYQTLIGLLAVTGMLVGEAIRLNRADVDLPEGMITVWHTKFDKSRAVASPPEHHRGIAQTTYSQKPSRTQPGHLGGIHLTGRDPPARLQRGEHLSPTCRPVRT
jgi:integrase